MSLEDMLQAACERCEGYSGETQCEIQKDCPTYMLYKEAKKKKNHKPVKDEKWLCQGNMKHEDIFLKSEML